MLNLFDMRKLPRSVANSGQALLLILLSMAVVLTVVLSILSRSITDVTVTTKEEEALRAFSAAEAGIEQSLVIGSSIGSTQIGDASFKTSVTGALTNGKEFANPVGLFSGESLLFWFVAHNDTGALVCNATLPCFTGRQIKICWGKSETGANDATTPAIEVSTFYAATPGDYSTVRIARITADPNIVRRASNNFSAPDAGTCTTDNTNFQFQKTIDLASLGVPAASYGTQNGLQFTKVRMFYNTAETHPVGIFVNFAGNSNLPAQGLRIESTGVSGDSNRKIDVFQGYGEAPPVFDSAIFSLGGITK